MTVSILHSDTARSFAKPTSDRIVVKGFWV